MLLHFSEFKFIVTFQEKDLITATEHIRELNGRLKQLDMRTKELQDREISAMQQANQFQQRQNDLAVELKNITG